MTLKLAKLVSIPAIIFSLFSCSGEDAPIDKKEPEIPAPVTDVYNYIALRNDGNLYQIGDRTGKVVQMGKIPGIEFNTILNSVTSSASKVYIYEHRFDPPRGILYVWDRQTNKTESAVLDFPEEFGENTALMSLDWDEEHQNLVGITREDIENPKNYEPIRIVRINPVSFEVTTSGDLDLNTSGYANVFSTNLLGQKLFAVTTKDSSWEPYLLEIDLNLNTLKVLPVSGSGTGMTNLGNSGNANTLFGFSPVANSNYMGEVRPVIYNVQAETATQLSQVPPISALNFSHKTFFNKEAGEFAELVGSDNKIRLFRYQPSTGDYELIEIPNPENLSTSITIVGAKKI